MMKFLYSEQEESKITQIEKIKNLLNLRNLLIKNFGPGFSRLGSNEKK